MGCPISTPDLPDRGGCLLLYEYFCGGDGAGCEPPDRDGQASSSGDTHDVGDGPGTGTEADRVQAYCGASRSGSGSHAAGNARTAKRIPGPHFLYDHPQNVWYTHPQASFLKRPFQRVSVNLEDPDEEEMG